MPGTTAPADRARPRASRSSAARLSEHASRGQGWSEYLSPPVRNSIRPVTWLGLAASAVLAISVVGLFYFQQRAVLLDSSMARQDRLLLDLAQALQDRLVSQMRLGVVVAYVVRRSPPEAEGREQAFALLSSDSAMEQLLEVREGAAPRRLWSRSDGPLRPGRRFYRFNREISATDLEVSRGSDSAEMATLSVRIKGFRPRTDLELVSSLRGLQLAAEPYMLNQGLSLGVVTQDGLWFPLFQRDSTDSASFGRALPEPLLAAFRAQEQGGFTARDQELTRPFPAGSVLKWRRIQVWGGVPWTLVLHAPEKELAGNAAAQLWRYALVFGIVGLLWGLAVWQLVRRDLSIVRLQADLRHLQELRQKDEQIVRAEKLATIGVLVSGLAHEIGTPLGVVSMRLELLQRRFAAGSDESQTIDLVLGQLRRVTSLIRQLLDFARSKPGSAEPVDLGRVLSTVGDLMDPIARRRRVRLEVLSPGEIPMISGSSDSVQQILLNLVLNALQAVEENGFVRVEVEPGDEGKVVVLVEDDGPGIPPEKRNAVFDPFFTTKRQGEGSGLGLTVVLGLVRRMGADLTLHESALGGAKFVLAFGRWDGK